MQTPNAVDTYSRYQDELFDEKEAISVSTVWQGFFGKVAHNGSKTLYSPNSEVVDIDIMRGNEKIAALIQRGTDSRHLGDLQKNTDTQKFSSFSRVFPFAEELGDITASQLNRRMAGENPYEGRDKFDRMRDLAREHHLEHIRRYVRLFEYLAGTSLLTGQMPAILGTTKADLIYDFRRAAGNFITVGTAWDQVGADILGDIDAGYRQAKVQGKVSCNVIFFAGDVASVFFNDSTIQTLADIRGFSLVRAGDNAQVPPALMSLVDGGAAYRGFVFTPQGHQLFIFCYDGTYDDDSGNSQDYMPAGTAFMAYYGARCDRYFGPDEKLPLVSTDMAWYQEMFGMSAMAPMMPVNIKDRSAIVTAPMFYCDAYPAGDRKKVTIRTQSAPIFVPTQTDAFVKLIGLITP